LSLAYLIQRAKRNESLCGLNTDAIVIWRSEREGTAIPRPEMRNAEDKAPWIDRMLHHCILGLVCQESAENQREFLKLFSKQYRETTREIETATFPSLGL